MSKNKFYKKKIGQSPYFDFNFSHELSFFINFTLLYSPIFTLLIDIFFGHLVTQQVFKQLDVKAGAYTGVNGGGVH